jgi:hypothetical protein
MAVVAETRRARFLFETRLPTRYYIPPEDVRMDLLLPSETVTRCPYKGQARYYSVKIGDKVVSDLVLTYPDPIPECRCRACQNIISRAVKGLPSCHFTPGRSRNVSCVLSSSHDQSVARSGTID